MSHIFDKHVIFEGNKCNEEFPMYNFCGQDHVTLCVTPLFYFLSWTDLAVLYWWSLHRDGLTTWLLANLIPQLKHYYQRKL